MNIEIGKIYYEDENYRDIIQYCNDNRLIIELLPKDEKGQPFTIKDIEYSKIELLELQIEKLKQNLRNTDYIASKIADAYALYKLTGDDLHLDEIMTQYEPMLQQREQWREQIRELEKQINE